MRKILTCFVLLTVLLAAGTTSTAQSTSAGKSFYVDYDIWKLLNYPSVYINCGNDNSFNTGNQLTLEVWARAYIFGENRKIMGKMTNALNNGYVLGFENLNIYSEIFNPNNQQVPHAGTGPLPLDSAWVHLVTTYDASGQMVNYLNGENVGEITVFPQTPIAANTEPFIIGLAPWDLYSYEYVGNLDEVRVWNVARTQTQIREDMFRPLTGMETGLVAYYNFDRDVDSVIHDKAPNHLNGLLHNSASSCFWYAPSYAPVGDSVLRLHHDLQASWYGKNPDQYTYAITTNGLSMITSIGAKEFEKYVVFGHNNATGTSTQGAPAGAPAGFERLARVWYVNKGGSVPSQLVFNLTDAAAGGAMLTSGAADSLYTLLVRNDSTGTFTPLARATQVMGATVLVSGIDVQDQYYTLAYSPVPFAGVDESAAINAPQGIRVFPNPVQETLFVELHEEAEVTLCEVSGRIVCSRHQVGGTVSIPVAHLRRGVYVLSVKTGRGIETQKINVQ